MGDNETGKTTLVAKLQGVEDPKKGSALEYAYIDVRDEYRDGKCVFLLPNKLLFINKQVQDQKNISITYIHRILWIILIIIQVNTVLLFILALKTAQKFSKLQPIISTNSY